MLRSLIAGTAGLAAVPAFAHEAPGLAHLHPHGGEAMLVLGLLAAAAFVMLRLGRRGR